MKYIVYPLAILVLIIDTIILGFKPVDNYIYAFSELSRELKER